MVVADRVLIAQRLSACVTTGDVTVSAQLMPQLFSSRKHAQSRKSFHSCTWFAHCPVCLRPSWAAFRVGAS